MKYIKYLIWIWLILISPKIILAAEFTKAQTGVTDQIASGTELVCDFASNPTEGDVIVYGIFVYSGLSDVPVYTVEDGNNNVYTQDIDSGSSAITTAGWIGSGYLVDAPADADDQITFTFEDDVVLNGQVWCDDFTPTDEVYFDSSAFSTGNGTINSPEIPVNNANSLLYAVATDAFNVGNTTGDWTGVDGANITGSWAEYDLDKSSDTSVGFDGTALNDYNAIGMSFYILGSGPPDTTTSSSTDALITELINLISSSSTSTMKYIGSLNFGLAIIIAIISIAFIAYIYNSMERRKPWKK